MDWSTENQPSVDPHTTAYPPSVKQCREGWVNNILIDDGGFFVGEFCSSASHSWAEMLDVFKLRGATSRCCAHSLWPREVDFCSLFFLCYHIRRKNTSALDKVFPVSVSA